VKTNALHTALRLGRVSNVPTVWTNVLAGFALAGEIPGGATVALLGCAISLFYVGGMYLNDAFDAPWDVAHRSDRPIPAGLVRRGTVFAAGFAMLLAGAALVAWGLPGRAAFFASLALGGLIVLYDVSHKGNPLSPLVMALCRVCVYAIAALAIAVPPPGRVYIGAAMLFAYLVFLSAFARREFRDPRLPRLVGTLVAGIALVDGLVLLATGHTSWAAFAVAAFVLTRFLQKFVPGS
jgi:4-hydroxybenzoate polyprenyltransferase